MYTPPHTSLGTPVDAPFLLLSPCCTSTVSVMHYRVCLSALIDLLPTSSRCYSEDILVLRWGLGVSQGGSQRSFKDCPENHPEKRRELEEKTCPNKLPPYYSSERLEGPPWAKTGLFPRLKLSKSDERPVKTGCPEEQKVLFSLSFSL